jgi:hypothetical protein
MKLRKATHKGLIGRKKKAASYGILPGRRHFEPHRRNSELLSKPSRSEMSSFIIIKIANDVNPPDRACQHEQG